MKSNNLYLIVYLSIFTILLILPNVVQSFKTDAQVSQALIPFIGLDTFGNQDFVHAQYSFIIYGEIGNLDTEGFSSKSLTSIAPNTFWTFDVNQYYYYNIDYQKSKETNNIYIKYNPDCPVRSKVPRTTAPFVFQQAMYKEYDTPFHSEAMGLKTMNYIKNDGDIPELLNQDISYMYTMHMPCSVCTSKLGTQSYVNSRASDLERAKIINGQAGVLPPPVGDITYWIDSTESVTNLLYPSSDTKHTYIAYSRQWDDDFCHYSNILSLIAKYQVVTIPLNRYKQTTPSLQDKLVTNLLASSTIRVGKSLTTFSFWVTGSDETAFQYFVDQAFQYFITNKMENFRFYDNWAAFIKAGKYPDELLEITKKALLLTNPNDCTWSKRIYRLVGVSGSKKGMPIKRTLIPIAHPYGVKVPTCMDAGDKFPCVTTADGYHPDQGVFQRKMPSCIFPASDTFNSEWNEVLIDSGLSPDEQSQMTKKQITEFLDARTTEFIRSFDRWYVLNTVGEGVDQCAYIKEDTAALDTTDAHEEKEPVLKTNLPINPPVFKPTQPSKPVDNNVPQPPPTQPSKPVEKEKEVPAKPNLVNVANTDHHDVPSPHANTISNMVSNATGATNSNEKLETEINKI